MRRFRAFIAGLTIAIGLSATGAGRGGERAALGERGRRADGRPPCLRREPHLGPASSGVRAADPDQIPTWISCRSWLWRGGWSSRPPGSSSCARTYAFTTARRSPPQDVVFSFERAKTELPGGFAGTDREHRRGAGDRRSHRAHRDQVPRPAALGKGELHRHRVKALGYGARRPGTGERQRRRGELRVAARQRHRPLRAERVRARTGRIAMVRNPDWWGFDRLPAQPRPNPVHPDRRSRGARSALLRGDLDLLIDPPFSALDRIKNSPGLKLAQGNELRTIWLGLDQSSDGAAFLRCQGSRIRSRTGASARRSIRPSTSRRFERCHAALPAGMLVGPGTIGYARARPEATLRPRGGQRCFRGRLCGRFSTRLLEQLTVNPQPKKVYWAKIDNPETDL